MERALISCNGKCHSVAALHCVAFYESEGQHRRPRYASASFPCPSRACRDIEAKEMICPRPSRKLEVLAVLVVRLQHPIRGANFGMPILPQLRHPPPKLVIFDPLYFGSGISDRV
jgi:hypothetical protein